VPELREGEGLMGSSADAVQTQKRNAARNAAAVAKRSAGERRRGAQAKTAINWTEQIARLRDILDAHAGDDQTRQ
jgi:hypothetical protein